MRRVGRYITRKGPSGGRWGWGWGIVCLEVGTGRAIAWRVAQIGTPFVLVFFLSSLVFLSGFFYSTKYWSHHVVSPFDPFPVSGYRRPFADDPDLVGFCLYFFLFTYHHFFSRCQCWQNQGVPLPRNLRARCCECERNDHLHDTVYIW